MFERAPGAVALEGGAHGGFVEGGGERRERRRVNMLNCLILIVARLSLFGCRAAWLGLARVSD